MLMDTVLLPGFGTVPYHGSRLNHQSATLKMFGSLYSDQGYRRRVCSWNAVDVLGKEGLLEHGTIIAVESDGVVVDFGCEDKGSELVHYDKAFSCRHGYSAQDKMHPGCDVDVLLRAGPQKPWVWRPATLLAVNLPSKAYGLFTFVEVHLGGVDQRMMVESDQVRLPLSSSNLQSHLVRKDDFYIWSVRPLPAYLCGLLPTTSPLWKVLCQKLSIWMLPISVTSEELLILEPSYYTQGAFRHFDPECMIRPVHEGICRGMANGAVLTERGWRCCLPLNIGWVEPSARGLEWTLHDVHPHMLKETFIYLDTMEKTQRRRVCRTFNALLIQVLSREIWISCQPECGLRHCCSCSGYLPYYQLTSSILNCATTHTRRIILTNSERGVVSELLLLFRICGELGLCALSQQVSVIAFRCNVGRYPDEGHFWVESELLAESMAGGRCKQLQLHQCTLGFTLPDLRVSGSLSVGWGNLCRLVEGQLPVVDLQRMAEAVARAVHLRSRDRWEIMMVLEEFTKPDPRETNPYQGHEWTESNLHTLDLFKLSRLAQYALSCHVGLNLFDQLPFVNGF